MMLNTRRRALALLLAAAAGLRLLPRVPHAFAAKGDCYDSKDFGPWKAQATDAQAGVRMDEVKFVGGQSCDLRIDLQGRGLKARVNDSSLTGQLGDHPVVGLLASRRRLAAHKENKKSGYC